MIEVSQIKLGAFATNCYLIKKEGYVLIVDPGARAEKVQAVIQEEEVVEAILLTHGHFDHIGAVDKLQAHYHCPVYLSSQDEELARSEKLNSMGQFSGALRCPIQFLSSPSCVLPHFTLSVTEAPGHTKGSVLLGIENYLFVGDVLFKGSIGRTDLYSGNDSEMKNSLRIFHDLPENLIVCPGHDEITTIEEEIKNNPYL